MNLDLMVFSGSLLLIKFMSQQCDVILRNIATFEVPYDTASADIDRRKLRFLREKIADEFLMRYAVMGLPRSERILPHIQVMTLSNENSG